MSNLKFPRPKNIPPEVWEADVDELLAAGWVDWPRSKIPANWRDYDTPQKRRQFSLREARRRYDASRPGRRKVSGTKKSYHERKVEALAAHGVVKFGAKLRRA